MADETVVVVLLAFLAACHGQQFPTISDVDPPCQCSPAPAAFRPCTATGVATYRLSFDANWTNPAPRYQRPSFDDMITVSHSPCSVLWREGNRPSLGLQYAATVGQTVVLAGEAESLDRRHFSTTQQLNSGVGSREVSVEVDRFHHVVSSVSFMKPSPDWFVGVDSVDVCQGAEWRSQVKVELTNPWDAGVQDGVEFDYAGNRERSTIKKIRSDSSDLAAPFRAFSSSLGTFTLTLTGVDQQADSGLNAGSCPLCTGTCRAPSQHINPSNNTSPQTEPEVEFGCNLENEVKRKFAAGRTESFCPNNPNCQRTCVDPSVNELHQSSCSATCFHGCFCQEGLMRHRDGRCVSFTECGSPLNSVTTISTAVSFPGFCPVDPTCAHFHPIGTGGGRPGCCPTCRQTISVCKDITCPAVLGCLRYATQPVGDECCLRCIRYRKKTNPDSPCASVKCPSGQVCSGFHGKARCICKRCKHNRGPEVFGTNGVAYDNACHRSRASCMTCSNLTPVVINT